MGRQETNKAGMTVSDSAQCRDCLHAKVFHGPKGCFPLALRKKEGLSILIFGEFEECNCKEFSNKFIQVMGCDQKFASVQEARDAGVLK
jgi:hypothetical protein